MNRTFDIDEDWELNLASNQSDLSIYFEELYLAIGNAMNNLADVKALATYIEEIVRSKNNIA